MNYVKAYTSAARTATPTKIVFGNYQGARGAVVVINTSAAGTSPSTTFTLQGYDPLSNTYWTLLASAAVTAVGTTVLKVYPGLTASANAVASDVLPSSFAVDATHGNATSHTYSVGVHLIP